MTSIKLSWVKPLFYPWAGVSFPARKSLRPYFGPPTRAMGGPGLKREKLIRRFGNHLWGANLIYVTSGLPLCLSFLKYAKSRGAKVLLNQDGVYSPSWFGGDYAKANEHLSAIHTLSDYVIYQSQFCKEAAKQYLRVPAEQSSEILYNGVDLDLFSPRYRKPKSNDIRLLCAGYFYVGKHYILNALLDSLPSVLREYPHVSLCIAGKIDAEGTTPANAAWVEAAVTKRRLPAGSVTYQIPYGPADAPELFRGSDIFIHLKNNDPCPSIVLEALASGLPVVHCRNGGTTELVQDAGVAISHEAPLNVLDRAASPSLISQAIITAIQNRESLSAKSRQRVEHFSITRWYDRHESLMNSLCFSSPHA